MTTSDTPETDALFWRNGYPVVVDSSKAMQLCEKLEQERDWITEKFKLLEGCFKRAERERDEARAERDILRSNKMSDPLLETTFKHLNRERDEACQVANGLAKQAERLRKERDQLKEAFLIMENLLEIDKYMKEVVK